MRTRNLVLLIAGVAIGGLLISPATSHVGGTVEHLWDHLLPKAKKTFYTKSKSDGRYVRKSQTGSFVTKTLRPGESLSGVYSVWGTGSGGYFGGSVSYSSVLPDDLDSTHVQFVMASAFTAECAGRGLAAPGYLCVYEAQFGNRTFGTLHKPEDGTAGSGHNGFGMYFDINGAGGAWSYGEWTVTAPTSTTSSTSGSGAGERGQTPDR